MASKIDKEALKKNLFWILLGVFVVLWMAGIGISLLSGDDKAAKDYKTSKDGVEAAKSKGVKTAAYQEPWNKHGKTFRSHKDKIWAQAWEMQVGMYSWPDNMLQNTPRPLYPEAPFALDATGKKDVTADQSVRSRFRDWYLEQFNDLEVIVTPAEFNGGFFSVFGTQTWDKTSPPTQEEIWLAQEDFWVKRELLFVIRRAMDSVALFREIPVPKGEKLPDKVIAKRIFRNANWELNLLIEENAVKSRGVVLSERSTIKNINIDERTQVLANPRTMQGLPFRFQQGGGVFDLRIAGEPLPYGKEAPITKNPVSFGSIDLKDPNKPLYVEQLLAWEISPVRRVDMIALARHSHRTITGGLKLNPDLKALEPVEVVEKPAEKDNLSGGSSMPTGGSTMPAGMGTGGTGGTTTSEATTINKIPRERYLVVTPQCRHLPVVVRLIVDQAHIHDILTSFSNSLLRMQITQVSFHHVRGVTRSPQGGTSVAGGPKNPEGSPPPGSSTPGSSRPSGGSSMPGLTMPMMGGMGMGSRSMGSSAPGGNRVLFGGPRDGDGPGVPGGGTPGTGTPTARIVDDARLVELSIYAIASIYERFPARPKDTTTPPVATPPSTKN